MIGSKVTRQLEKWEQKTIHLYFIIKDTKEIKYI